MKNNTFSSKLALATFWASFERNKATFYFTVWSHCNRTSLLGMSSATRSTGCGGRRGQPRTGPAAVSIPTETGATGGAAREQARARVPRPTEVRGRFPSPRQQPSETSSCPGILKFRYFLLPLRLFSFNPVLLCF